MIRPSERIWALVSGLPRRKRADRPLMVLQAFFDDSGNEPNSPVFVLAGLITTPQRWAEFSDEWQAALDDQPRLDYFKMAEAEHFNKQFRKANGWTNEKRDERVLQLACLVTKYAIGGIYAYLSHEKFDQWIRSIRSPSRHSGHDHPYFTLFHAGVQITAYLRLNAFMNHPCDIVFDSQGSLGADAVYYWHRLRNLQPVGASQAVLDTLSGYSAEPPIFRNEKEFLPLQAADLYAWHLRRKYSDAAAVSRPALLELGKMATMDIEISDDILRGLSHEIVNLRETILKGNPGLRLYGVGEGPRRRPLAKKSKKLK
jgi:Protein of unknown function (DUF3800)